MSLVTQKAVFIHIPKTGGTFVHDVLFKTGLGVSQDGHPHDPARFSEVAKRLPCFCFVRHPVNWFLSLWGQWNDSPVYRKRNATRAKSQVYSYRTYSPAMLRFVTADVEESVDILTTEFPGFISAMFADYANECEFVGRQEDLINDLIWILKKTGHKVSPGIERLIRGLAPRNVSRSAKGLKLNKRAVRKIMDSEHKAITRWGYGQPVF